MVLLFSVPPGLVNVQIDLSCHAVIRIDQSRRFSRYYVCVFFL